MMNRELLELYSDYLLSAFSHTTATGLSAMTAGAVSHDRVTRFLASEEFDAAALWRLVKPMVRQLEDESEHNSSVLIIDDTIEEKPYTDESELICWHYDHSKGRSVKGINLISALYQVGPQAGEVSVPVTFELVKKGEWVFDGKKEKWRRKSLKTKNEMYREMLSVCHNNRLKFRYVLSDVWYSASENMNHIKRELEKEFIMPLKSNRKVALCSEDKQRGLYERVASLELESDTVCEVYLEQVGFPLLLAKRVFKNEDGSEGWVCPVCTDSLPLSHSTSSHSSFLVL